MSSITNYPEKILYKSHRIIDGKPKLVIVDENGNIVNKNPSKEQLRLTSKDDKIYFKKSVTRRVYYNKTNTCDRIKDNGHRCGNELIPTHAYQKYDKEGNWTGEWICRNCRQKELADCRNNNLDPRSAHGIGFICEQITCKTRGVDNLNILYDNFNTPIDHNRDPELGIIQTKGAIYNASNRDWCIYVKREQEKEFNYMIVICMSKDMKNVERVYIFPKKEILKRNSIRIYKNSSRGTYYEKYKVDEKPYNDAYHNFDESDYTILKG